MKAMTSRTLRRLSCITCFATIAVAQTLSTRPRESQDQSTPKIATAAQPQIDLSVPAGTPLKVALDKEVRIQKVGQPIHGKLTEPVYSFDQLVIPVGSGVDGTITSLEGVSKWQRTAAALDANFSPPRRVKIDFKQLTLPDGRVLPIRTVVSPASPGALQFVPANNKPVSKTGEVKSAASREVSAVHHQLDSEWVAIKREIHQPGKMHKIKRYAQAQLPYHPQYIDPGTGFNADLQEPLRFGSEVVKPEMVSAIGDPPPSGSVVHALLVTPLGSATSKKGDPVDAVISQPLVIHGKLFLPEGSHLKGIVLQVQPARRLGRNGHLRIVFHQVAPPSGLEQKVEASLEGVEVARGEHLSLDAEGGAQVTAPRTRYLTTGIAVMLAAASMSPDRDAGAPGQSGGEVGLRAANGASGFKVIGFLVGAFVHSRAVSSGFGIYGAATSIYSHFLSRGRDVVYPKDMQMVVGLGTREAKNKPPKSEGTEQAQAIRLATAGCDAFHEIATQR